MSRMIRRSGFRLWAHVFMVLLVVGLFMAACGNGGGGGGSTAACSDGYTYCSGSGKCCKNGYPYHCNTGSAAGSCYQSKPTNPPCTYYDYCSG